MSTPNYQQSLHISCACGTNEHLDDTHIEMVYIVISLKIIIVII
jgi:hypothetical protein